MKFFKVTAVIVALIFSSQGICANALFSPKARFLDANGNPLVGGKVFTYEAGTTTPLATYTDAAEGTANANPVILDANGEANIWVTNDNYKIVLKNSADVTQWTVDNFSYLRDGAVTAEKLASNSVTTAKIADLSVTTAKVNDLAITTGKINDLAVTTGKINDLSVTTEKLAAGAVTQQKRAALGQQVSAATSTHNNASTWADITNMTVTITTTGRPVFILIIPSSGTNLCKIEGADNAVNAWSRIRIVRDGTSIGAWQSSVQATGSGATFMTFDVFPAVSYVDVVAAGTYVYKYQSESVGDNVGVSHCKMVAFEL